MFVGNIVVPQSMVGNCRSSCNRNIQYSFTHRKSKNGIGFTLILPDGTIAALPRLPKLSFLSYVVELADGDVLVANGANVDEDELATSFLLERGR